ncbi:MAG: diaminopimelate decarboxylase, partial [Clostridia bacterium]|nr:diaminopimelate decarboxylase [Clostridia bacterium]
MILHDSFEINENGRLSIAGHDAVDLAAKFGTPAFIIDEEKIRSVCRKYREAFSELFGGESRPVYAGKALCFTDLYRVMREEKMAADCVSSGELATALKAGFPMRDVFFHGNNKTDDDIRYAISSGVGYFVADGEEELIAIDREAKNAGITQKILLRITPGIDPHTHKKIITGNVDSKFGSAISTGRASEITALAMSLGN